jgi:hypothetical protein
MPDNDRIPRSTRRHWHKPCKAMIGGQEPAYVGHAIDRALAATLRDQPLAPPHGLAHEMCEAARLGDSVRFQQALDHYRQEVGIGPLTSQVVAQAVTMMELGEGEIIDRSDDEIAVDLVIGALRRYAEASLCGADDVNKAMLEDGANFDQVRKRQRACLDAAQLDACAAQILAGAARPRTPPIRIAKPSTAELLNQPL